MLNKRTNILFDEELWNKLTRLAKSRNTSVGDLVRNAVSKHYELNNDKIHQIQEACKTIESIRPQAKGKIDYKALINYGRKY